MRGSGPIRSGMTMRAWLERDENRDVDEYNQREPPSWRPLGPSVPCRAWAGPVGGKHAVQAGEMLLVADLPGAVFPAGTDVAAGDLVRLVTDRAGASVFAEKMLVDYVALRGGCVEARLRRYA